MFQSLDTQVDPCVNFYQFTCGQFEKTNQLPPQAATYGSIEKRDLSINNLYHAALLTDRANDSKPITFIKQAYRACVEGDAILTVTHSADSSRLFLF